MFACVSPARPLLNHPGRFLVQLLFVSLVVLWLAKVFSADLVALLLPAIRAEVTTLDDNVSVLNMAVSREGPNRRIRMQANLLRPIYVNGHDVYPLGWKAQPRGWYQVNLNAGAALKSSLILLIVLLSWPARTPREFIERALIAAPLTLVLLAIDAPLDLLGNFQEGVVHDIDPHGLRPLFVWSKFLEGGGNSVLALAFSVVAIALAARRGPVP